jgi:hypothetical protein
MRTIIRGVLAAIFLVISLIVVLSESASRMIESAVVSPMQQRLVVVGLIGLAGLLSDRLIFVLVPAAFSRLRRLLHALVIVGVFVVGLIALAMAVEGPVPKVAPGFLDLSISWPFIVVGGIGLVGHLLDSLIIRPLSLTTEKPSPKEPPRALVRYPLLDNENLLCLIQPTRLKMPINREKWVATDRRFIIDDPTTPKDKPSITHYNYFDLVKAEIRPGKLFCTVWIEMRFKEENRKLSNIPNQSGKEFVSKINEQIQKHIPDAVYTAQHRLAAGEISQQTYEELVSTIRKSR